MEKYIRFRNKAEQLSGIVHIPEKKIFTNNEWCVVFLHGWVGYRIGPYQMFVRLARELCENGFFSLRFDFRGRGDSEGNSFEVFPHESELDAISPLVSDVEAAIDYIKKTFSIKNIVLLGMCNGGEIALYTAQKNSDIKLMILWSTSTFLIDGANEYGIARFNYYAKRYLYKLLFLDTWKKLFSLNFHGTLISKTLFVRKRKNEVCSSYLTESMEQTNNSEKNLKKINAERILLVYGSEDPNYKKASYFYKRELAKQKIPFEEIVIFKADHNFSKYEWQKQILRKTVFWLKQKMEEYSGIS